MQASTYGSVKGKLGFEDQNQRRVLGFGELKNRASTGSRNLWVAERTCSGGLSLRATTPAMGAKLAGLRMGSDGISMSTLKPRSVHAQASASVGPPQARGKTDRSVGIFHDDHHLSPGSVLEASFSSSSLDDSSGNRSVYPHSTDYSDDQLQLGHDTDSVDSATSVDKNKTGGEIITALFNNVSRILHSIDAGGQRLSGGKLTHANEVILNAELLFGDVTLHNKGNIMEGLFISPLLLDLETIADTMITKFCVFSSFGDIKELGEFLFDFVIES